MLAELNIIGLIIAIVVAIIASFIKKKTTDEEWEVPPELKPRRPQPSQPARTPARSWEEELRQILAEGRQPPPPPIVRIEPPVPPPMPVTQDEYQRSPGEGYSEEPSVPRLHTFTEAAESHAHAASLLQRTQEQLHQLHSTTHRAAPPASVHHVEVAPEIRELLKTLRQPQGARSAILASVILGPPRALSAHDC